MTADNLMLLLRAKSAEARAEAAAAERDRLHSAAQERRDPWLTQVPCTAEGTCTTCVILQARYCVPLRIEAPTATMSRQFMTAVDCGRLLALQCNLYWPVSHRENLHVVPISLLMHI